MTIKKLTQQDIENINKNTSYSQGVFVQPNNIPVNIKTAVIYSQYIKSGYEGGNCWDDAAAEYFENDPPKDHMKVLETVLEKICPQITLLQHRKVLELIRSNDETEYEYYGNSNTYYVEYIILDELYSLLEFM